MRGLQKGLSLGVWQGRAAGAGLVRDPVSRRSLEAGLSLKGTNGFFGRLVLRLEVAGPRGGRSPAFRWAQRASLTASPRRRATV